MYNHVTTEDRSGKNLEESPTLSFCSKYIYSIPNGCLTNLFINHLSLIPAQHHHQQKVVYIAPLCPLPQMQGNVWHFFLLIGYVSKWLSSLLFADNGNIQLSCWQVFGIFKFDHEASERGLQNSNSNIFIGYSEDNLIQKLIKWKHHSLQTFYYHVFLLFLFYFKHAAFVAKICSSMLSNT